MKAACLLLCLGATAYAQAPEGMIRVPAGEFMMGMDAGDGDERPAHLVDLKAYYIGRHEVTNAEYARCLDAVGRTVPVVYDPDTTWPDLVGEAPNHPVVGVTWEDAVAYAEWRGARLPTEAEWEKAARGTDGRLYPWGNATPDSRDAEPRLCNLWSSRDTKDGHVGRVASHLADISPYGARDMGGNVSEWVSDRYSETYYHHSPTQNPPGAEHGSWRVVRGGSWATDSDEALTVNRRGQYPRSAASFIGFRLAKDAE